MSKILLSNEIIIKEVAIQKKPKHHNQAALFSKVDGSA
jgi:hypothetical protein